MSQLYSPNCYHRAVFFISSPRTTGRGGALATVFNGSFQCSQVPTECFSSFEVQTFLISDHMPVLCARIFLSIYLLFSAAFTNVVLPRHQCSNLSTDELLSLFNTTSSDIMDVVAPLRAKRSNPKTDPWLNESTCALRKKDQLQVSLEIMKDSLQTYQRAVKAAK